MSFRNELHTRIASSKPIIVAGLGKSGLSAARLFLRLGAVVWGIERKGEEEYAKIPHLLKEVHELQSMGMKVFFNDSMPPQYEKASLAVVSPGIPLHSAVPRALMEAGIQLIGELELGIEYAGLPSIIVTGSNGKSTVVTLLAELLRYPGSRPYLCGNIGRPVVELLDKIDEDPTLLVVEASSYQLEIAKVLKPKIGVLLNISENHLERHGSLDAYLAAKLHLFQHQDAGEYAIMNFDDQILFSFRDTLKSSVAPFGSDRSKLTGYPSFAWIEYLPSAGKDHIELRVNGEDERYEMRCSHLIGEHTRYNWAAALLAARLQGASRSRCEECISSLHGLEHRLEIVRRSGGQVFINDSKSTTVASTVAAVDSIHKAFPAHEIFLLLGGKVKLGSWESLAVKITKTPGISVTCFGGDGEFIKQQLGTYGVHASYYPTLHDATKATKKQLSPASILLLSPGCASFDEFLDFEDRGRAFKRYSAE